MEAIGAQGLLNLGHKAHQRIHKRLALSEEHAKLPHNAPQGGPDVND